MTDRNARDQMAKVIRSYMNEEITAFQFDEALDVAMNGTKDMTVQSIRQALWFHYDDCTDHKVVANKEEWGYFNRVLLLLESNGEMVTVKSWRKWRPIHGVAAALFVAFIGVAFCVGFGEHLFAYAIPFGPPSMIISWLNSRWHRKAIRVSEVALMPFPSVSSLLFVRRQVSEFVWQRCPSSVLGRKIRDPFSTSLMLFPSKIAWCMFSPVILFFQMLPDRGAETTIKMSEPSAGAYALPHAAHP